MEGEDLEYFSNSIFMQTNNANVSMKGFPMGRELQVWEFEMITQLN